MSGAVNFVIDCRQCGMKCSGDEKKTKLWVKLHMKKAHAKQTYTSSQVEAIVNTSTRNGNTRPNAMNEWNLTHHERVEKGIV